MGLKTYGGPASMAGGGSQSGLSDTERKVLSVLQEGLPATQTPYGDMARRIGIETRELLKILEDWKCDGRLRRIGAVVDHFKVGVGAGAMVVWRVAAERVEEVGQVFAAFEEVSHSYERTATENWPYCVYTMVHGATWRQVEEVVRRMSEAAGVSDWRMLATERELKKVPPRYIGISEP